MNTSVSFAEAASQSVHPNHVVEAAAPLSLQIIPSVRHHQGRDDEQVQLATTMRSLVLDQQHPIALEIAGTHQQRCLLIRARNADDLQHAETQLHARLPQASFVPLVGRDDPFHLLPDETVSVVELHAGQASYLPLQEFERMKPGEDPLLGLLGALDALPSDLRAITQIALVPAPATWSQSYQRKALEHALEPERQRDRQNQATARDGAGAPSTMMLVLGALFLAGYFLFQQFPTLLPVWMPAAFQALAQGQWQPVLSGPHHLEMEGTIGILILLLLLPLVLQRVWKRLVRGPLYDMRSVAEKTSRPAYHVRLRLYVIGPGLVPASGRNRWQGFLGWCAIGCNGGKAGLLFAQRVSKSRWQRFLGWCAIGCNRVKAGLLFAQRVSKSRWQRFLLVLRVAGTVLWFEMGRCVSLGRARQWKQATQAFGGLILLLGKGGWSLMKRVGNLCTHAIKAPGWLTLLLGKGLWSLMKHIGRLCKHAIKALGWLIPLIGRRVRSLGTWAGIALVTTLTQCVKRRWQDWQETRYQQGRRGQILARLIAAYRQYHLANGNYFVPKRVGVRRAQRWVSNGTWWKGVSHSRHLLDVQALGALWHMPADDALPDLAHLAYRRSRSRLLPPGLRSAQLERPIGFSEHAGHHIPFGLPADCLQSHLLIGGKSGEGKSTLMQHLALRSMLERHGLVVIDPHGDLVEQILTLVPADRMDDVVLLDLSDEHFSCGLNPIDATVARGRDKAISDLIKILSNIWGTAWGSRMEIAFEYALRTLYEANKLLCKQGKEAQQYTLLDVMPILTNESFCHALLEHIRDPFILRWWATYYDPLSLSMQRDRVDPVLSKVAKFESTLARHIVGQSLCTVDFTACIAHKKIVLVKLAKGLIGEDMARILGATVLGFLNVALEEQGKIEEARRTHVPILIDEFQTLDGVDWGALAELRKFGATFCLATQSLEYLREKQILPIVMANVKQLAIFRMSAEDAWTVHRELDVDPEDIVHLESLTCYLKLVHERRQQATFSLTLSFPPEGEKKQAERIRTESQRRFMRPASDIEREIMAHLKRQMEMAPSKPEDKKAQEKTPPPKEAGHARQDGGSRGRKGQEKPSGSAEKDQPVGEITPMNWQETVGPPSEEKTDAEEQEEDPGDRAE